MKAVVYTQYGPPEVLRVKEVAIPTPKDDQILLKLKATAITMGDCELRRPDIPNFIWLIVRLFFGLRKPRKQILGGYIAGEVAAVGTAVTKFKIGNHLFGLSGMDFGGYAEYVALSEKAVLTTLPKETSYNEAAPLGLGLDSLHFMKMAQIKPGQTVLINGAGGGIGTYALQLAKYYGAKVTAVDSADKLAMLLEAGADCALDYRSEGFKTMKQTFDVVFDVVGKVPYQRSLELLEPHGRYISANPQFSRMIRAALTSLGRKKKIMTGLTSGKTEDLETLKQLMEEGHLSTIIDRCYSLDQMAEAHQFIEDGLKKGNAVLVQE